ncbi:hypothetical protein THAOC_02988 [Thalassiosira oceanica]|uniref:Uncharacterized protein n=1 Tax=Thalassiosira oceanica TaxID=159749 RepID=K0TLH0_THAOC|nr:hypothetical protein THAOC_02988 [Thalassiosira oceanica]|eukprot:EJK75291.1 hypothetical protein THAOC_02988 [Thalassiosira oceanica]
MPRPARPPARPPEITTARPKPAEPPEPTRTRNPSREAREKIPMKANSLSLSAPSFPADEVPTVGTMPKPRAAPSSTGALPDRRRGGGDLMRHRRGVVEDARKVSSGNSPRATSNTCSPPNKKHGESAGIPIPLAVAGWYILGVLSITTLHFKHP